MEAFFKGKVYSQIAAAATEYSHPHFLELDFVLRCTTAANNLLKELAPAGEETNWAVVDKEWARAFSELVQIELSMSEEDAEKAGLAFQGKKAAQQAEKKSPAASQDEEDEAGGQPQEEEGAEPEQPEEAPQSPKKTAASPKSKKKTIPSQPAKPAAKKKK